MNERLIDESERILRSEIESGTRFVLLNEQYGMLPAESRALIGRQIILMQETLKTIESRKTFERTMEQMAEERLSREQFDSEAEFSGALDVFTQVRAMLSAGAVHRSGMRIDQADLETIKQHLNLEVVELNNLFIGRGAIDHDELADEACDILGILVYLFLYIGLTEQDVANRCAAKFAKRFTIPK